MRKEDIQRAYQSILGREPDDSGIKNFIHTEYSHDQLVDILKRSKEYKSRISLTLAKEESTRIPAAYEQMERSFSTSTGLKTVVFSGCQAKMVSEVMAALTLGESKNFFLSPVKIHEFCNGAWKNYEKHLDKADYIYTQKIKIADHLSKIEKYSKKVKYFPVIFCNYFHPDITYISYSGRNIVGPMGDYHSIIATAAYFSGATEEEALKLFSPTTYQNLNYPEKSKAELERLLEDFQLCGIDISLALKNHESKSYWMRTINHPTKEFIHDIVKLAFERDNIKTLSSADRFVDAVSDDLAKIAEWPIYPGLIEPTTKVTQTVNNMEILFKSPYKIKDKNMIFKLDEIIKHTYKSLSKFELSGIKMEHGDITKAIETIKKELIKLRKDKPLANRDY